MTETGVSQNAVAQQAMEAAMDGVAILDANGEYVYVNQTHTRLYGYEDPSDLKGRSWRTLYDETEVNRFETEIMPHISETGQWRGESVGRRRDGRRFDQELTLSRLDDGGLVCIVRDITVQKRRERQLRLLHEATRDLMDTTDERKLARIAVDVAERVLDHSLTACWLFDPESDQLVPFATTDAVKRMEHTEDIEDISELGPDSYEMVIFKQGESMLVKDYQALTDTPTDVPLRTILMLPIGDHGVLHVGAMEVTEIAESERQLLEMFVRQLEAAFDRAQRERRLEKRRADLERQNDRLEEFAGTLSHDLRNPLNVAQARTQLALERGDTEELPPVVGALDRIEALIDDVLTLAREGQTVGEVDRVDVSAAVRRAVTMVDGLKNVEIRQEMTIEADKERLCTLFENLFRNSVEHGSTDRPRPSDNVTRRPVAGDRPESEEIIEHGKRNVTVTVGRCEESSDGFHISDDGPGFGDDLDRVFERGYSSSESGTGFGLNIVRSIAEAHGWSVSAAESETGGARINVRGVDILN